MKNRKLILALTSSVLALGVISTSIAAYVVSGKDKEILISGTSSADGDFTLTKKEVTRSDVTYGSENDYYTISYQMGMKANSTYTQSSVLAQIRFELGIEGVEDVAIYKDLISVTGSISGYGTYLNNNNWQDFTPTYNEVDKKWVFDYIKPIRVDDLDQANDTVFTVKIKLSETISYSDYVSKYSGMKFNYNVNLSTPSEGSYYYLCGDFNNWEISDKYRMCLNLDAENDEEYQFLSEEVVIPQGNEFGIFYGKENEDKVYKDSIIKDGTTALEKVNNNYKAKVDLKTFYYSPLKGLYSA